MLKSDQLTNTVFASIGKLFLLRVGAILINLAIIPLSINYVNNAEYGFWLTISAVISWIGFFDIGLTNGLRNKITELVTKGKIELSRIYVSSTFAWLALIGLSIGLIFTGLVFTQDFAGFLKISDIPKEVVTNSLLIVIVGFVLQFVLNIITSLLYAYHKSDVVSLVSFLGQLLSLIGILLLKKFTDPNIIYLVLVFVISPLLVNLAACFYLFGNLFEPIRPSVKKVKFYETKDVLSSGAAFFIIQMGALVLFQTDNFIISNLFGPEKVTEFNVGFKLFSFISMLNFLIMTPYWSAFTQAWVKKDFPWMKKNLNLIRVFWIGFAVLAVIIFFFSDFIIKLWVGDKVRVSKDLLLSLMFYSIAITFQASHNYIINGIGRLKLQTILMLLAAVGNIPLSIFLGKKFGLPGIVYANIIFILLVGIGTAFQANRLIFSKSA